MVYTRILKKHNEIKLTKLYYILGMMILYIIYFAHYVILFNLILYFGRILFQLDTTVF